MVEKIQWIGSLRGICALLVFLSHMNLPIGYNVSFIIGRIWVVGFFLIAGFLTPKTRNKRNNIQYAINRFIRMYPTFWLLLILYSIINSNTTWLAFATNLTLFNEFVGQPCLIGSSWMMPIQILFFGIVCMFWPIVCKNEKEHLLSLNIVGISIFSLVVSFIRYKTGISFPTALFLLLGIAFLGLELNINSRRSFIINLVAYEVALIVSACFSYTEVFWRYIIAYNLGILLFFVFKTFQFQMRCFDLLGEVGFVFFLCPAVTNCVIDFLLNSTQIPRALVICIQFMAALIFAVLIHMYIEKPIIIFGRRLETKMKSVDESNTP